MFPSKVPMAFVVLEIDVIIPKHKGKLDIRQNLDKIKKADFHQIICDKECEKGGVPDDVLGTVKFGEKHDRKNCNTQNG